MAEPNNGLMKKTKAQLIEIILRKDEVERNCRTEISNLSEKLKKLEDLGTKIYRTDEDGTIILTSDGENMSFETVKTDTNGG